MKENPAVLQELRRSSIIVAQALIQAPSLGMNHPTLVIKE